MSALIVKEKSQSRKLCGIEDSKHCIWIDHGPFQRFWSTHQLFGSLNTGLVYDYTSVLQKNIYYRLQCYQLACASWFSGCPHLIHHPEGSDLSSQPASINHSPYQPDLAVLHRLIHDYLSLGESPVFRLPFPHLSLRHPYLNGQHSLTKRAPLLRLEWPGFSPAKLAPAAECANRDCAMISAPQSGMGANLRRYSNSLFRSTTRASTPPALWTALCRPFQGATPKALQGIRQLTTGL